MASSTPQIRAWTYTTGGYPDSLELTSIPAPSLPPPPSNNNGSHLLIRTTAAALNPVDIQLMNLPLFTPSALPFPLSLLCNYLPPLRALADRRKGVGADFAGEVIAAHEGSGFKVGDRVFGLAFTPASERGTLSEALLLDTNTDVVARVPHGWTDEKAASLPLVALTARTCVERCVPFVDNTNNTLVVLGGSSATGLYTTLLASSRGWRVVATCSARNDALVRAVGAAETIDYTAHTSSDSLRKAVAAHAPAAIVDCVGGTALLGLPGVRRYITIVGDKTSRSAMGGAATYLWNPQMALRALASDWIPAGWPGARSEKYACVNLETRRDWLEEAVKVVGEENDERVVVDSVFGFEDVKGAYERLDSGRCRGKVVVRISGAATKTTTTTS
ncbi:alcohol dehydrogenase [Phyllosticta capitalensis]